MVNKKTILFVIPSLSNGGAERVVSRISSALSNKNYDVNVLTFYNTDKDYDIDDKVKVTNLSNGDLKTYKGIGILKRLKLIKKYIKNTKPDVIFPFLDHVFIFVMLSIFFTKYRKKTSFLIRNNISFQSRKIRFLLKLLIPFASKIIAQNNGQKESLSKGKQKKTFVIPNPIDEKYFKYDKKLSEVPKYIVSIGRLEKQKNYKLSLSAFANVSKKYSDLKYIIYGKGSLLEELNDFCKQLDITSKVEFRGFITNKEKIYSDCDIFVLSSDYEGMPNSLIESLAIGVPSISTDCKYGPKEIIVDPRIGILLEDNSVRNMELAIERMVKNYQYYAENINYRKEFMRNNYSIDKIVSLWVDIF